MNYPTDKEVAEIPTKDNGERLVDLRETCPKIEVRLPDFMTGEGEENRRLAGCLRETVAKKLCEANSALPAGYKLMLRFGYRSCEIQKLVWDRVYKKMIAKYPNWREEKIKTETQKFAAPVGGDVIPPHSTGGTADVSILDKNGEKIDMGTDFGEFNEKTAADPEGLTEKQTKNRQMLRNTMTKAGFVNYHAEWWHWSYGDQYWAAVLNKKHAIYGKTDS